jgi:hypothetical protein
MCGNFVEVLLEVISVAIKYSRNFYLQTTE